MSRVRATGQLPKEQSVDDGGGVEDETLQFLNLHHWTVTHFTPVLCDIKPEAGNTSWPDKKSSHDWNREWSVRDCTIDRKARV